MRTMSQAFRDAHETARRESVKFGISYKRAFSNALRGVMAVQAGFRGVEIIEPASWNGFSHK